VRSHKWLNTTLVGLLLTVPNPLPASTVKGVVLKDQMGGEGVADVRVSAIEGANPVLSLSDGTFVLEFPNRQPGDTVLLIVQKPGMVVVNEFQLQLTLPKAASAAPLILLLCRAAQRDEMTRRFHRLNNFDAIEQRYQKKFEDLQAKNQATEAAKEQLRIERDQAREAEQFAAEKLARAKLGEASELYLYAMSIVYQSSTSTTLSNLGIMYRRQNRLEEARKAFDEALEIRRKLSRLNADTYLPDVAETLNDLGNLLSDQNRMQEALEDYDEALEIRRKLAQQKRQQKFDIYMPAVATTLNNLGILRRKQNRMEEARKAFDEALEIRRTLAQRMEEALKAHEARPLDPAQRP